MKIFTLQLVFLMVKESLAEEECKGILRIKTADGEVVEFDKGEEHIEIEAESAEVVGCKCFTVFEKPERMGRSVYLDTSGEKGWQIVPLPSVRSLALVTCSREAMAAWSIMVIVVGVISVTGVMIAVLYKRMGLMHQPMGRRELCQHDLE